MTNEERLTTIKAALDLGLQAWRATTARRRFVDAYDAVDALAAELAETQRALAYVDECFERDGDPVTAALREAARIAEAWATRNEDARHVAALIASALPPLADAGGVIRAALASGSAAEGDT